MTEETLTKREEEYFAANERLQALLKELPMGVSFSNDTTCHDISGNPAAHAQFEVEPGSNLSASAPDSNAPGRQLRFVQYGRDLSPSELQSLCFKRVSPLQDVHVIVSLLGGSLLAY